MDPTTLLGLLAVLLILVKAIGSALGNVYNGIMLLVVVGGDLRTLLILPFKALFPMKWHTQKLIQHIVGYAETARREGILALEQAAHEEEHPFQATGIRLAVDGTTPELIQNILQTELTFVEARHRTGKHLFALLGINWALFGLIATTGTMALGRGNGMETALPLFYGLVLAGAIAWPIHWKAGALSETELLHKHMSTYFCSPQRARRNSSAPVI
jgi:chemotaxis protein MotA